MSASDLSSFYSIKGLKLQMRGRTLADAGDFYYPLRTQTPPDSGADCPRTRQGIFLRAPTARRREATLFIADVLVEHFETNFKVCSRAIRLPVGARRHLVFTRHHARQS